MKLINNFKNDLFIVFIIVCMIGLYTIIFNEELNYASFVWGALCILISVILNKLSQVKK